MVRDSPLLWISNPEEYNIGIANPDEH